MKKFDPKVLPYLAAIGQAILFSIAGDAYFENFGWLLGLFLGTVVNASLAVSASRIGEIAQKRKPLAWISLVALFLLSPTIICLSILAPQSIFTPIAWAVAPDLAIVLTGATTGRSLLSHEEPAKPKAKRDKPATQPTKPAFVCSCGAEFGSQSALNAHQRKHKRVIGYTASFEPITESQTGRQNARSDLQEARRES